MRRCNICICIPVYADVYLYMVYADLLFHSFINSLSLSLSLALSLWYLEMFLGALSFAYFSKSLSGSYMKSTITQLERRFDIPSYLIGVIDGSFEVGE